MKQTVTILMVILSFQLALCQSPTTLDTITNINVEPFNQVCYQEIYRARKFLKNRNFQSTGFLIAPNIVLTAAHNLYSPWLTRAAKITIIPGRYGNRGAYDTINIFGKALVQRSIKVHPKFRWHRADFDFGIIVIPDSIIKKTNNWPTRATFSLDSTLNLEGGQLIHVAGFPASHGYDGSLMTYESQYCGTVGDKTFSHDFDTQTGNSGSPVWIETSRGRKIVGIHTYAQLGTRINKEHVRLILKWVREMTRVQ